MKNSIDSTPAQICEKKRVLYARVSSVAVDGQNLDRQLVERNKFDYVIEDRVSGVVDFFQRPGGAEILKLKNAGVSFDLYVHSIDRLGRDLLGILNTLKWAEENSINIISITQGFSTLTPDGAPNPIGRLICSLLGAIVTLDRERIISASMEGIRLAKLRGVYKGRKQNTKEDVVKFLTKPKNAKALELIQKGYKLKEAAILSGIHPNTVTKIRRLARVNWNTKKKVEE